MQTLPLPQWTRRACVPDLMVLLTHICNEGRTTREAEVHFVMRLVTSMASWYDRLRPDSGRHAVLCQCWPAYRLAAPESMTGGARPDNAKHRRRSLSDGVRRIDGNAY